MTHSSVTQAGDGKVYNFLRGDVVRVDNIPQLWNVLLLTKNDSECHSVTSTVS